MPFYDLFSPEHYAVLALVMSIESASVSIRLWYEQAPDAIDYAKFYSRSHDAVIHVYDEAGNAIEAHYGFDEQERK